MDTDRRLDDGTDDKIFRQLKRSAPEKLDAFYALLVSGRCVLRSLTKGVRSTRVRKRNLSFNGLKQC